MEFTKEQTLFVEYVDEVMESGDELRGEILLNAPAGCGKTYLAKYFDKKYNRVIFLAPTHKAKNILGKDIKRVDTIHRFFKAKANYRAKDGELKFTFGAASQSNVLIVVDECSMISDEMYTGFKKASENNLVVYLGDDLQLPPINEEEFDENTKRQLARKSKTFDVYNKFTLTENKRCEELVSTLMLNRAREACYNNRMPPSIVSKNINHVINDFVEKKDSVVLAFTNVCVNNYNNIIRSALFNEDKDSLKQYYEQEVLIFSGFRSAINVNCKCKCECDISSYHKDNNGNECVPHWRNNECNSNDIKYYSSYRIIIDKLSIVDVDISYEPFECDCYDNNYNKGVCKEHKSKKGSIKISFYKIVDQNGVIWYKPIPSYKKKFEAVLKQYNSYCSRKKQSKYWAMYYKFCNEYNADLNYSYALTIHKSQGSQWDNVYVDRTNIVNCLSKDQLLKLCCYYTAISRMKTSVYDLI